MYGRHNKVLISSDKRKWMKLADEIKNWMKLKIQYAEMKLIQKN